MATGWISAGLGYEELALPHEIELVTKLCIWKIQSSEHHHHICRSRCRRECIKRDYARFMYFVAFDIVLAPALLF